MKCLRNLGFGLCIAAMTAFTLGQPAPALAQNTGTITGQVVDGANNRPIVGAQVSVVGTDVGTLTRGDARYNLLNVPAGQVTIRVQFIGYATAEEVVNLQAGETVEVNFRLRQEALGLDEIVVTGTAGQARRREVGNTISQINLAQIDEPIASMDNLLSGRVTAMTVNPGSGTMGAGAMIRLRGNVSISTSNQPLIYIDGIRQGADSYPLNRSGGAQFWQSPQSVAGPLNDLNPNDIDRIEVVKGAAATTLYGSEAAGGVIQIFTKRGREGDASWTYQVNGILDRVQEFGSSLRPYGGMKDDGQRAWGWDQPLLRDGYLQQHDLSVTGGTPGVRYFLSGRIEDGRGIHPNDEQTRVAVRGNVSIQPRDNLSIDWNTSYSDHDMQITHVGNNLFALQFNAYRAPGSTVAPERIPELLDAYIEQQNSRLNTGVTASWIPSENFTHRFTVGLDRMESEMAHITPFGFILESQGSLGQQRWTNEALSVEYVGNYDFRISPTFRSQLAWGAQNVTREERLLDGWGQGFPGPGEHTLDAAASRLSFSSGARTIDAGFFAQNMFDLHDRYFLTIGARVDGNSTFGDDLGLQVYPKVSASWVVSDEDFWPGWGEFRVRGAYGHAGRAPGPFDAVRTWTPLSFAGASAFIPGNAGNPDLGPERTEEIELGFESSFRDDRIRLDLTYYHQSTTDALLNVSQIPSGGFIGSQLENIGEISNQGFEVDFHASLYQSPEYSWDMGLSLATNKSRVEDTGGQTYNTIVVGQPVPVVRGNKVLNPNEFADPIIERPEGNEGGFYGPNQPTRIVGVNTSVGFPRGIRFTARGEYQGGHYITQSSQWAMANRGGGAFGCDDIYSIVPHRGYADASPDQIAQLTARQRAWCYNDNLESGFWTEKADFFKIRELTLQVPVDFALPMASSATFAVSARNIRVWTHEEFSAFDPEMVWAREGLTALTTGIAEVTPAPMQFTASVRVSF
jgi:TonB-dependent starch-binding outer membrane protein SusC